MVFSKATRNYDLNDIVYYTYFQATTEEQREQRDLCHHCEHRAQCEAAAVVNGAAARVNGSAHGLGSRNGSAPSAAVNGCYASASGASGALLMLGGLSGGGILERVRTLLDEQALAMRRSFERVDGLGAGFVNGADFRKTLYQFGIPIGVIELDFLLTRYARSDATRIDRFYSVMNIRTINSLYIFLLLI